MDFEIDPILLEEFKLEAFELFEDAEEALILIDKGELIEESFNKAFRSFHSIKGGASIFSMMKLSKHVHILEELFESRREKEITKAQVDYFLLGIDVGRSYLRGEDASFQYIEKNDFQDLGNEQEQKIKEEALNKAPQLAKAQEERTQNSENILQKRFQQPIVFIVEDDPGQLSVLEEIIMLEDFKPVCFENPLEALEQMDIIDPDVILTDLKMPKMDGLTFLKKVRETNVETPVIFLSAFLEKKVIYEAINYGAFNFLEKPYRPNIVTNIVSMAHKKKQVHRLLDRTVNFMIYQLKDFELYLKNDGKEEVLKTLNHQVKTIMEAKREILTGNLEKYKPFEK